VVLIAGCTPGKGILPGKKSDIDLDCGGDYCSENFSKIVRSTYVDGKCVEEVTECDQSEICVADSTGVECEVRELAKLSCSENSKNTYLDPLGKNIFDKAFHICGDDCPVGFDCNAQCICECPAPVFINTYFTPIQPDLDFDTLYDQWEADRGNLLDIVGTINISAYDHIRDGVSYYLPFPEVQLELIPNPDNEYIHKEGWEAYCVNDYYDGEEALDIQLQLLMKPKDQTCDWGGTTGFEGVLTVCPEDLVDWFDTYFK
jgi:hypothetical protein